MNLIITSLTFNYNYKYNYYLLKIFIKYLNILNFLKIIWGLDRKSVV